MINEIEISNVKWGERAREDYGDITDLADSIQRLGLIQPIVLDDDNNLIAGGRRLTAVSALGRRTIPFVRLKNLSPLQKLEIELEENIKRKNLTWQEEIKLKNKILEIKSKLHPDKTKAEIIEETAELFSVSKRDIYRDTELAEAIKTMPELESEKNKHTAITKLKRIQELRKRELHLTITKPKIEDDIRLGDAVELIQTIPDNSVDLILFDPPFGVNYDEGERLDSYVTVYGDFRDTIDKAYELLEKILPHFPRVLKPDGHCYIFSASSTIFRKNLYELYSRHLVVHPYLLFWVKQTAVNRSPFTRFSLNYEPFFFCHLEKPRKLHKSHFAFFKHNFVTGKAKQHPAQKPLNLYKELIELSTIPGETILDPMMGSGVSLVAGKQLGRKIIGFEIVEEWFTIAKSNILNYKNYREEVIKDDETPTRVD